MTDEEIVTEFTKRGFGKIIDDTGECWSLKLSDETFLFVSFGMEPTRYFGPPPSWDWYVSHAPDNSGGEEIGDGNGDLAIVLETVDNYIRDPGWARNIPTSSLIKRIGVALWGETWATQMAREMDIAPRTAHRFATNQKTPRDGLLRDFRPVLIERRAEIDRILTELPE